MNLLNDFIRQQAQEAKGAPRDNQEQEEARVNEGHHRRRQEVKSRGNIKKDRPEWFARSHNTSPTQEKRPVIKHAVSPRGSH